MVVNGPLELGATGVLGLQPGAPPLSGGITGGVRQGEAAHAPEALHYAAGPGSVTDRQTGTAEGPETALHPFDALSRACDELRFLQRISAEASATRDHEAMLKLIVNETTGVMGVDVCSLYLLDEQSNSLVLQATNGLSQNLVGRLRLRLGEGVTGWVAKERRPLAVPDVAREPRFKFVPGVDDQFTSMLSVPVIAADRVVGVMNLQTRQRRVFDAHQVGFLRALAGQVAGIIEISYLHHEARRTVAALDRANRRLVRASEIHTRFTRLALADRGFEPIAQTLADLLGERVLVETLQHQLVVWARPRGDAWRNWQPSPLSKELAATPDVQRQLDAARRFHRPVTLGPFPEYGLTVPCTLRVIAAGREQFGFLGVIHERALDEEEGIVAMEQAATVLALEFLKQKVAQEVEQRLRGDFIEQLLAGGREEDLSRLAGQAAHLGLSLEQPYLVALAEVVPTTRPGGVGHAVDPAWLPGALGAELARRHGGLAVLRHDSVVLILPTPHQAATRAPMAVPGADERSSPGWDTPALERVLRALESAQDSVQIRLAVSAPCAGAGEFPSGYRQARQVLETMRRTGHAGVMTIHELGAYQLLLAVKDERHLHDFAQRELGLLLDYDTRHGTYFVATLEAVLRHNGNLKVAAAALHVHVNTLAYRLRRIREITGADLDDADRRVALYLALLIRRLGERNAA